MSQNVGTLISAAIRPNDSLDPIASAFAGEIKGGLHTATASSNRNSIIFERREWGMMCYVINDDKTYQLNYNYADTNIMNNSNWVEFSGSGGGGGNEWIDSVLSVNLTEPLTPSNGDRYLVGRKPADVISGTNWSSISPGFVAEWNGTLLVWDITYPTDGMSVRVDNEDNSVYKYETDGVLNPYPSGKWVKEKSGQVRSIDASFIGGFSYSTTSDPEFNGYVNDMLFLTKFDTPNYGNTASLNVNGLGDVLIKKPTPSGISNLNPYDITTDVVYSLVYDGTYLQLNRTYVNEDLFNVKYYIEPTDYIVIPPYYQYWVYGDLTIDGSLTNYGQVIIADGSLINSGTFSNYGALVFVSILGGTGGTFSYLDSDTIDFTTIGLAAVTADVKPNSLTSSHLDTDVNGGATAGYILSVDNSGYFDWKDPSSLGGLISYSDKSYIMGFNTSGNGSPTGLTISQTPKENSYTGLFVNGQEFQVGYGTTNSVPCYFSNDGGTTARTSTSPNNVQIGDELYWNGTIVGTDLYTTWRLSLFYQV